MHSNCIRAAFERQFKDFDGIRGAFSWDVLAFWSGRSFFSWSTPFEPHSSGNSSGNYKDSDGIRGAFGTFLHSGRDVPTQFEPHSCGNRGAI